MIRLFCCSKGTELFFKIHASVAMALSYTNSNVKISLLGLEGFVFVVLFLPEAACH